MQHCGMTAPERFLFAFSPNPEMLSLHREEERRERGRILRCSFVYTLVGETEDFVQFSPQ